MKNLFYILILSLLLTNSLWAFKKAPMPKFVDNVTFYISFDDGSLNADITEGNHKVATLLGKKSIVPGLRGKGLLCGQNGAKIRFKRQDNLKFGQAGTIVFFYKGLFKSLTTGPRTFFWGIESTSGYIGQQYSNGPKNACPCQRELHTLFLFGKRIKNKTIFTKLSNDKSGCEKYHMVAFSWAPGQLTVKFDKDLSKSYIVPFEMGEADFPADNFSIGSNIHWEYVLDEFTIYNIRLNDSQLNEIYDMYFKK